MAVFAVTTLIPTEKGFVWYPFETDCETLEELRDRLIQDRVVVGIKYKTGARNQGRTAVLAKHEHMLGIGMVGTIAPLHVELDDETGSNAARPRPRDRVRVG